MPHESQTHPNAATTGLDDQLDHLLADLSKGTPTGHDKAVDVETEGHDDRASGNGAGLLDLAAAAPSAYERDPEHAFNPADFVAPEDLGDDDFARQIQEALDDAQRHTQILAEQSAQLALAEGCAETGDAPAGVHSDVAAESGDHDVAAHGELAAAREHEAATEREHEAPAAREHEAAVAPVMSNKSLLAPPQTHASAGDDVLAEQIQAMLDDASGRSAEAGHAGAAAAAQALGPDTEARADDADDADAVHGIDAYLAEHADSAVAGDFETVHQVLAEGRGSGRAGEGASAADVDAELRQDEANASAADARPGRGRDDDADALEGSFEMLDDLTAQHESARLAAAAATAATAKHASAHVSDRTQAEAGERETQAREARSAGARPAVVHLCTQTLLRACGVINKPLARRPGLRHAVGYVALVTLFNASVLLLGKLALKLFAE